MCRGPLGVFLTSLGFTYRKAGPMISEKKHWCLRFIGSRVTASMKGRLRVEQRENTPERLTETAIVVTGRLVVQRQTAPSISFPFLPTSSSREPGKFFHNKRKYRFAPSRGGETAPCLVSVFSTLDPQVRPSAVPLDRARGGSVGDSGRGPAQAPGQRWVGTETDTGRVSLLNGGSFVSQWGSASRLAAGRKKLA